MATGMGVDEPEQKCVLKAFVEGKMRFRSTSNWIQKIPLLRFAATDLDSERLFFFFMPKSTPHKRQTFMVVQTVSETMQ